MSLPLVILLVLVFLAVLSQFGFRLPAKSSGTWWLAMAFLLFAAAYPTGLRPVADLLGVQIVSNLILAAISLFLFVQLLDTSIQTNRLSQRMRHLVSETAARDFLATHPTPAPDASRARVLVSVPCYNEQAILPETIGSLEAVVARAEGAVSFTLCVINDGSSDRSEEILRRALPTGACHHPVNLGVGGVLMTSFRIARACDFDYVVQCDADGQHPFDRIPDIVREARSRDLDLLIGSRYVGRGKRSVEPSESSTWTRRLGGLLLGLQLRLFGKSATVSDPTSGFRVYSRQAYRHLLRSMPDDYPEPETIALLSLAKMRIDEFPVQMSARVKGISSISGLTSLQYMLKVITALFALRLRAAFGATTKA